MTNGILWCILVSVSLVLAATVILADDAEKHKRVAIGLLWIIVALWVGFGFGHATGWIFDSAAPMGPPSPGAAP